ncbi:MAG: ImmA/IrrE family metallo-endopeptidase [Clostridium sp.]|jgi:HTH-type transcriptional regulator / antitoxin HigA|nr:ImmA/IrrE family metallo-endopeptidase [Clostridium sp.]
MQSNYMVATGIILKEYIEEKNINLDNLSKILEISKKNIEKLFDGKIRIDEDIAKKLEKVIPEVPASYWLNIESKYSEYLSNINSKFDFKDVDLQEISRKFKFREVFKGLNWDLMKQAIEMLEILKIDDFNDFNKVYSNLKVDFFEDGGEKEAIAIWLNLCKEEADFQTEYVERVQYSHEELQKKIHFFKSIAYNKDIDNSLISCKKLCNKLGIYFVELEPISNSKVRGALLTYNNHPAIFISRRFKSHDHIWFAIAHELGHLINHYNANEVIISLEDQEIDIKEEEANEFARDLFISKEDYYKFIEKGDFSSKSIESFSARNRISSGILVGRLQHDKFIKMSNMNHKKIR